MRPIAFSSRLTRYSAQTASAFWSVLVAPKHPIMKDVLAFISVSLMSDVLAPPPDIFSCIGERDVQRRQQGRVEHGKSLAPGARTIEDAVRTRFVMIRFSTLALFSSEWHFIQSLWLTTCVSIFRSSTSPVPLDRIFPTTIPMG